MVTIDALSCIMYSQLALSLGLFFAIQILVLVAREKIEAIGDWIVYKGTWIGVAIQVLLMIVVGALVLHTPTDPTIVAHAVLLIIMNTAWFTTLRLAFEFADYLVARRNA